MPRALIAEDEPILAQTLERTLAQLWPELELVASVPNGLAAVEQALALKPDILFLDIRMPGQTGLEAAEELAESWEEGAPFPHIVFVTAFDHYAVQAFERCAVDYVLKPVNSSRLAQTVARLKALTASAASTAGAGGADALAQLTRQLQALLPATPPAPRLHTVRAAVGNMVRMIPIEEVVFFQALDKYVNVATSDSQALIRVPLRELIAQLDPEQFRQISRSTVVNLRCVAGATRDETGKMTLSLRTRPERPRVSPVYAHLFRQM